VIGDIEAHHVRVLEFTPEGNLVRQVSASKGRDSNYLLLSVFGAEERSTGAKQTLAAFEKALREGSLTEAELQLEKLAEQMEGSAPEVSIARSRLQRRKVADS
jgi:hypothetical protein